MTCFEVNMVALIANVPGLFCVAVCGIYGTDGAHPSEGIVGALRDGGTGSVGLGEESFKV